MKWFLCNEISECKMNNLEVKHQFWNFGNEVLNFNFETIQGLELEFELILKMTLFGMDNNRTITIGFPYIIRFYVHYTPLIIPHTLLHSLLYYYSFFGKNLFENMRNGYGGLVFWELVIYIVWLFLWFLEQYPCIFPLPWYHFTHNTNPPILPMTLSTPCLYGN